jgi:uncharacterized protein
MRISESSRVLALAAALAISGAAGSAFAFESKDVTTESSPWDLFKFGFKSYKDGRKEDAIEAYQYAAEKGHAGAQWKLARMYAEGDGVKEDDYKAFQFFERIVGQGIDPSSPDGTYVSNALSAMAGYIRRGIPGSPVQSNPAAARDYYAQAAWSFGDPNAQFELGRMYLIGEGGDADVKQAYNLFRLSAQKGHSGSQAMFGNLLFQNGKQVRGLAMLTAALQKAEPKDREWILELQESAFAVANEADRRTSMALAESILKGSE